LHHAISLWTLARRAVVNCFSVFGVISIIAMHQMVKYVISDAKRTKLNEGLKEKSERALFHAGRYRLKAFDMVVSLAEAAVSIVNQCEAFVIERHQENAKENLLLPIYTAGW